MKLKNFSPLLYMRSDHLQPQIVPTHLITKRARFLSSYANSNLINLTNQLLRK